METLLVLALWAGQFIREAPNYPVVNAPVVRYTLPPNLTDCKLVAPYKMTVQIAIMVGADGNAKSERIAHSTGNPCVDKQVLAAAAHYRFSPALRETKPIPASITLSLNMSRER